MEEDLGPSLYDRFKDFLYTVERSIGGTLGISDILEFAAKRPQELGYRTDDDSGEGKTMRHLLLAGELYRTHPALANSILNGHEYVTNVLQNQPPETRARDLFNNNLGKEIGLQAKSREDVERLAKLYMARAQNENTPLAQAQFAEGFSNTPAIPEQGTAASAFHTGYTE